MPTRYRLACTLGFGDIFLQLLVWTVLIIVTFGLASLFFAYYFVRLFINNTEIIHVDILPTRQPPPPL